MKNVLILKAPSNTLSTEAKQDDIISNQTDGSQTTKITDTNGVGQGVLFDDATGCPTFRTYYDGISEGDISNHTPWSKIGYNAGITTNDEDVWTNGGVYVFPTVASSMNVASSDATADADIGTLLFTGTCDATGSTTTMNKVGVNFAATVVAGDYIIIDKAGSVPEWGIITAAANGSVTFSGGLSMGGSCATARTYQILDASAAKGAMAVKIDYLTDTYAEKTEIVILSTNNDVPTVNTDLFRINSFRIIAVGSKVTALNAAKGNLTIKVGAVVYSFITAGFTRARNAMYTVPAGKTLHINEWNVAAATPNNKGSQTARVITRANIEPTTKFRGSGLIFYTYTEVLLSNEATSIQFPIPTTLPAKTDIKISAIGLTGFSGSITSALRGWLVTN